MKDLDERIIQITLPQHPLFTEVVDGFDALQSELLTASPGRQASLRSVLGMLTCTTSYLSVVMNDEQVPAGFVIGLALYEIADRGLLEGTEMAGAVRRLGWDKLRQIYHFAAMRVKPEFRGHKLGSALMDKRIEMGRAGEYAYATTVTGNPVVMETYRKRLGKEIVNIPAYGGGNCLVFNL